MLSHSLQQQVVDGREMIVAAALQRLMETEQISGQFTTTCGILLSSSENLV